MPAQLEVRRQASDLVGLSPDSNTGCGPFGGTDEMLKDLLAKVFTDQKVRFRAVDGARASRGDVMRNRPHMQGIENNCSKQADIPSSCLLASNRGNPGQGQGYRI